MSENPESAAQQHDNSTPKPPVEREVGQYSGGDYGEGGTVSQDQTGPESGGYAEGNYGEGGTAGGPAGRNPEDTPKGITAKAERWGNRPERQPEDMPKGTMAKAKRSAPAAVETVRGTLRMQFLAPLTRTREARSGKPDSLTAVPPRWHGTRHDFGQRTSDSPSPGFGIRAGSPVRILSGHAVHRGHLGQVECGQCSDVPDRDLKGPERAERGSAVLNSRPWHVRQVCQLGCLVHDVPGCSQRGVVEEYGDFEEP